MKILFLDSPSFGKKDMIEAFEKLGFEVQLFYHKLLREYKNEEFDRFMDELLQNTNFDCVFSFNYYPSISNGCNRNNLKYISFVYDNPLLSLFSYTLINPCNYVFIFDKHCYTTFANEGIKTVYYLPLCANVERLSTMTLPAEKRSIISSDISFVGALYNEDHNLLDRMQNLEPYTRGYIDAIMQAQMKVNGYFFIEELLTSNIVDSMKQSLEYTTIPGGTETLPYVYANFFIARKITAIERQNILSAVSNRFQTKLYTHNPTPELPYVTNMGSVDYYEVMPHIFKNSKINLNITLRSIQSGIPLRAWDILGSQGFLLSNYQADFLDFFTPGEDYDYFDGTEDLLNKIEYYLSHDKERKEIAENGYRKVKESHTYLHRAITMLKTANLLF